ncbi:hypothetical protein ZIOFF_005224 [Zingiber officinale]|uniref:indole-3-pyruvate monooxygenase n=1 Tax=Zingiber officinale TaxID=94328 RepID=A0A8J5M471_ZINOF|nr:hypothetical protein ZIOFF_005224 [Zingiber officinale]
MKEAQDELEPVKEKAKEAVESKFVGKGGLVIQGCRRRRDGKNFFFYGDKTDGGLPLDDERLLWPQQQTAGCSSSHLTFSLHLAEVAAALAASSATQRSSRSRVAACLKERGIPSVVLERAGCIASLWQLKTYDRLRLHLPKQFCELPQMPFPAGFPKYPDRRQFVSYLEAYAGAFDVRPRFHQTVVEARYDTAVGLWRVRTSEGGREYFSRWLVVATGENAEAVVPDLEGAAGFRGTVAHTSSYKSGDSYRGQRVLVVGCGNSGMEVCLDLCDNNALPTIVVRDSDKVRKKIHESTASIAPQLRQPPNGILMTNERSDNNPEEATACIALSKNDSYATSASGAKHIVQVGLGDDDQGIEDDFSAWRELLWPELDKLLQDENETGASTPYIAAIPEYRVVFVKLEEVPYLDKSLNFANGHAIHAIQHPCSQMYMNAYSVMPKFDYLAHSFMEGGWKTNILCLVFGCLFAEYGYIKKPTEQMDVYSFGVVLLELITGRPAEQPESRESVDVVKLVRRKVNMTNGALQVLDPKIPSSEQHDMPEVLGLALLPLRTSEPTTELCYGT